MVLVGVDAAAFIWLDDIGWKIVHMIGDVIEGPPLELDRRGVSIGDYHVFIRFFIASPIVIDLVDGDLASG